MKSINKSIKNLKQGQKGGVGNRLLPCLYQSKIANIQKRARNLKAYIANNPLDEKHQAKLNGSSSYNTMKAGLNELKREQSKFDASAAPVRTTKQKSERQDWLP
ncbi:hypothetical protein O1C43_003339 [Vibrio cholerae]|uniref:hypothetical protein n=1 Tax=Vibrio cholerae TaxID=666 RepID=UPI001D6AC8E2|nr:hypothetical protein [Vibrio cholerae]EGQ9189774.1 hypothetical protein [Vibrio cholerae]EKF9603513.1 hypothetical protein [Vibrio cholerae]MDY7588318.1 hypothetical protein [Vibrio cholerae]